jgi:hypothetical protein
LHAVNAGDHARDHILAVLEMQAHASRLAGQAGEPTVKLDAFRRHRAGKLTLQRRTVEREPWRAHLLPVPLSHRVGPEQSPIPPAAELQRWRHVRNPRQIDTEKLQQSGGIAANGYPGPIPLVRRPARKPAPVSTAAAGWPRG